MIGEPSALTGARHSELFLIALSAIVILAPYTGDPTWDYFDAAFMSILTYITAPWSVGTLFRFLKKQEL